MKKAVNDDLLINKITIPTEEAIKIFKKQGMMDKVTILQYKKEKTIDIYECDGYFDYLYGSLVNRTGLLNRYELVMYRPGFLLRYPRADSNGQIPKF